MGNIIEEFYYYFRYWKRCQLQKRAVPPERLYRRYVNKPYWDIDTVNHEVAALISSGTPFMMGRFGAVELFNMRTEEFHQKAKRRKACDQLFTCAGFFPNDPDLLPRFHAVMKDACSQVDILGAWQNPFEDYYIRHYCTRLRAITQLSFLEPWRHTFPWSSALEGKRVLVVHPFEESIRQQYARHEQIFADKRILPDFELLTLKAVQTAGTATDSRFGDWFEALDWMCRACDALDFDVALVGCGAYGFPLAAHIRQQGKQVVHFGGSLQILFGIRGRRWDELDPFVSAMYNDAWCYPLETERPAGSEGIEGTTYWKKEV